LAEGLPAADRLQVVTGSRPGVVMKILFLLGGLSLHLSEHHGDCCPGSTVFVWMTELEPFHREITAKNYGYLRPGIETTFYGAKCMTVIDPFGNRIRFNEKLN